MAKQNAMLARIEATYREMSAHKVRVALQMAKDAADIAASEMFSMGEGRAAKWSEIYSKTLVEMMQLVSADGKDDPDFVYAKTKIDERLKSIYGKNFQPWEVRYDV